MAIQQLFKVTVQAPEANVPEYFTNEYAQWLYGVKKKAIVRQSLFGNIVTEVAYFENEQDAIECEKALTKRLHC